MQPRERLTAKEMQVAVLVGEGQTNREIPRQPDRSDRQRVGTSGTEIV